MKHFVAILAMAALITGCANSHSTSEPSLTYPYVATPEREAKILKGMEKVKVGMASSDVRNVLGEPDEVRKLYDPNINLKNREPIGYTWWFIIERKVESGSVNEKAEKLFRVSFDLEDKITQVDSWGIK